MNTCPLCHQENKCTANEQCWCFQTEIPEALIKRVPPEQRNVSCICPDCVKAFNAIDVGTTPTKTKR